MDKTTTDIYLLTDVIREVAKLAEAIPAYMFDLDMVEHRDYEILNTAINRLEASRSLIWEYRAGHFFPSNEENSQ